MRIEKGIKSNVKDDRWQTNARVSYVKETIARIKGTSKLTSNSSWLISTASSCSSLLSIKGFSVKVSKLQSM